MSKYRLESALARKPGCLVRRAAWSSASPSCRDASVDVRPRAAHDPSRDATRAPCVRRPSSCARENHVSARGGSSRAGTCVSWRKVEVSTREEKPFIRSSAASVCQTGNTRAVRECPRHRLCDRWQLIAEKCKRSLSIHFKGVMTLISYVVLPSNFNWIGNTSDPRIGPRRPLSTGASGPEANHKQRVEAAQP